MKKTAHSEAVKGAVWLVVVGRVAEVVAWYPVVSGHGTQVEGVITPIEIQAPVLGSGFSERVQGFFFALPCGMPGFKEFGDDDRADTAEADLQDGGDGRVHAQ